MLNFSLGNSATNNNFDFEENTDSVKYYNSKLAKIWDNLYNKNLEITANRRSVNVKRLCFISKIKAVIMTALCFNQNRRTIHSQVQHQVHRACS